VAIAVAVEKLRDLDLSRRDRHIKEEYLNYRHKPLAVTMPTRAARWLSWG